MKQEQLDPKYLRMAYVWASNSYAVRRKVGALIVRDGMIISDGFNGTPSGFENVCEEVTCNANKCIFSDEKSTNKCKNTMESWERCKNSDLEALERCNSCEHGTLTTKSYVLHAEANAITKLSKNGGFGCKGATLYVTAQPCIECSKLIIQSGITRVVYGEPYRDQSGIELLKRAGISVDYLPDAQPKS